jgi:hypothetical protein
MEMVKQASNGATASLLACFTLSILVGLDNLATMQIKVCCLPTIVHTYSAGTISPHGHCSVEKDKRHGGVHATNVARCI